MANYQVMFWKHIPSQVMAWEGEEKVKRMLPDYFQAAIDAYAMKEGSTDMDAYLEGWRRGPVDERAGTPDEVINAVVDELTAANPRSKLMKPQT
ncbi:MAG TPA: virulence factor [Candidatus Dormibacteraeota bacterium]|nr:virulence factor [Candidatus Dormibacteraeota bacterium]